MALTPVINDNEKIAIIGLGWLGLPLAKHFQNKGYQIIGTVRSKEKKELLQSQKIQVQVWDSKNKSNSPHKRFFEKTKYCIINIPPGKINLVDDYANDCLKILPLFCEDTKYIFISSTGIYPENIKIAVEDDFPRKNHLDNHLALAEEWLDEKLKGRLTIVRMAGLIGPNRHPAKFFAGKKNILHGNAPINLIHLKDCIQLIEKIIEKSCWGEVINGVSSEHPSRKEYYENACERFGFEKPLFEDDTNFDYKLVDNTKSKVLLELKYIMNSPYDYWDFI